MNLRIVKEKVVSFFQVDFIKNASTLMMGSVVSQIIPILFSPLIARLYFPEDYAMVANYNAVTILFTIIATGMYSSALMLDDNEKDAFNTGMVALTFTVTTALIVTTSLLLFKSQLIRTFNIENIDFWLYFVPITVFFFGGYQILNMWNNRLKRYKRLSINRILQTIFTTAITFLFGYIGFHKYGLVISLLLGQAFSFLILLLQTLIDDRKYFKFIDFRTMRRLFFKHKEFPLYNMPHGFLDGIRNSSIVFILSMFYGPYVLGNYSFAMNTIDKPFQFIGSSFAQVYYQKASELFRTNGNFNAFLIKIIKTSMLLGLPFALMIVFWGKHIFTFVFGDKWETAGEYSQIFVVFLLFRLIVTCIGTTPYIVNQLKKYLFLSILFNIFPVLILYLFSIYTSSFIISIICFFICSLVFIFYNLNWFIKLSK
jgi:O-antigen/teichoic acid export membrane protein